MDRVQLVDPYKDLSLKIKPYWNENRAQLKSQLIVRPLAP